jgi:hypothetical protein
MKHEKPIFWLFTLAAMYDAALGAVFLVLPKGLFLAFGVTLPNHLAYVQFPAALLIVFSIMFVAIAVRPLENRNLIPYGILLKISYCGIAFAYWRAGDIPNMWKPFAIIDLICGILFCMAYISLGKRRER